MNQIRAIQKLNQREIELGISPEASWHTDYRDTAFVNFGGLPYELTEGDIITIFSQYGEPVFLKLARDKETGKSKGFGWLKYEDQRSCDLAVDNIGGAEISGRLIRVDHARYKPHDDDDPEEGKIGWEDMMRKEKMAKGEDIEMEDAQSEEEPEVKHRPMIKEERELQKLIEEHDEDDPMKAFLIEEKKAEVEAALQKERSKGDRKHERKHRHRDRDHRSHRSRRDRSDDEDARRGGHERARRDTTPKYEGRSERDRTGTPERRPHSKDRHRRRRHEDEDRERRRDRERDGDRDRRSDRRRDERKEDSHRSRRDDRDIMDDHGRRDGRDRRRDDDGGRERERDRHRDGRHRHRSRSPRESEKR